MKETNVGFNLAQAMLSKQVDATLGAFWNYEGVDLERRDKNPEILRMEDLGVPTYNELIFVARRDGPRRGRRLAAAPLPAGHRARPPSCSSSARRPASTRCSKADAGLDRGLQEAVVEATLPVFFPEDE